MNKRDTVLIIEMLKLIMRITLSILATTNNLFHGGRFEKDYKEIIKKHEDE